MIKVGQTAPKFHLESSLSGEVDSEQLKGTKWAIFFSPKDNTPGCTVETIEFGRELPEFTALGVRIFGCSIGDVEAKRKFARDCDAADLPILADPDHLLAEAFGSWREPGRVARNTFAIDAEGKVERVWESVTPAGHAAEVLNHFKSAPG